MISDSMIEKIRHWLVDVFVNAIGHVSKEEDRIAIIAWLESSRGVIESDLPRLEKAKGLYALLDSKASLSVVFNSVSESVKNYKDSDLPIAVKIAIPVTLLASTVMGGQAVGVAALGSATGVPILLLVFLGSAGITSVIEAIAISRGGASALMEVVALIAADEALRQASSRLRRAMVQECQVPFRSDMPVEPSAAMRHLLSMDPYDFECHVMSFFDVPAIELAWVTKKSNDMGVDGFAKVRGGGLIIVQCKRYALENPVGRPDVQKFKGVIEEHGADRGYLVTTSRFTDGATESAAKNEKLILIDGGEFLKWHHNLPSEF